MVSVASRSSLPYWGSLVQSISGPFSPDSGYAPKVSRTLYQDIGVSSRTNTAFARALGTLPHGIGYGLVPFGSSLVSKPGYYNNTNKIVAPGPLYSFRGLGPPNRLRTIGNQGDIGSSIPEELALIILQSFDLMYTKKCTLYHKLAKNWHNGKLYHDPGHVFRGSRLHAKAYYSNSFDQFTKRNPRTRLTGYSRTLIEYGPMDLSFMPFNLGFRNCLPKPVDLCGDSDPGGVYQDESSKKYENHRKKGSGNASGHVRRLGREEQKRKRAIDEDEENDDADPPPSKRVDRNSPEPPNLRLALACPFAKADRHEHVYCLFIRRKNLSGIKEHLKRNHFGNQLPVDIRAAKTWDDLFDICNPYWHPTERPSPYFETGSRRSLASSPQSGASSVKPNQPEETPTFTPLNCQTARAHRHIGVEPCSPPLSSDGASPRPQDMTIACNAHPTHHRQDIEAPSSPSPCHGSKQGRFKAFTSQVEEVMEDLSTPPWLITTTLNEPEHRNHLESRPILDPNWLSTNSTLEGNSQHALFSDEFGVRTRDPSENIHGPTAVSSVDSTPNHTFDNPTTVDPSHLFLRPELQSEFEASPPWSRNNSASQDAGTFKHMASIPAPILSRIQKLLPDPSTTVGLPAHPVSGSQGEVMKPTNRSNPYLSTGKGYLLIVTRVPQNRNSKEPRRAHRFNFENLHEFQAQFEAWLRCEFTDPPFCWKKMMLFNNLEKAILENVEEVADNLEQTFIQYRSSEASLYLVPRNSHLQPSRPVTLTTEPQVQFNRGSF
ncbi:hypothetical protein TWF506_010651 [Arthrobotrys conoides]|uniref:Uncharacterized protein n=1 Tax=Arthrobotrys conoides TaxID=74498 RepID=A0AAN8NRX9_9PEZI